MGKEDELGVYEKVWGYLAFQISIATPQTFRVGDLLESLSLIQDRVTELLQKM